MILIITEMLQCTILFNTEEESSMEPIPSPSPPPVTPTTPAPIIKLPTPKAVTPLPKDDVESNANRWGKKPLDKSYEDELRRQELAEERRRKQQEMYDKLKSKKTTRGSSAGSNGEPKFEDCKF